MKILTLLNRSDETKILGDQVEDAAEKQSAGRRDGENFILDIFININTIAIVIIISRVSSSCKTYWISYIIPRFQYITSVLTIKFTGEGLALGRWASQDLPKTSNFVFASFDRGRLVFGKHYEEQLFAFDIFQIPPILLRCQIPTLYVGLANFLLIFMQTVICGRVIDWNICIPEWHHPKIYPSLFLSLPNLLKSNRQIYNFIFDP